MRRSFSGRGRQRSGGAGSGWDEGADARVCVIRNDKRTCSHCCRELNKQKPNYCDYCQRYMKADSK